jgi:hypothetical protein
VCELLTSHLLEEISFVQYTVSEMISVLLVSSSILAGALGWWWYLQWGPHQSRRDRETHNTAAGESLPYWYPGQSQRDCYTLYRCETSDSGGNIHMWNMWIWDLPGLESVLTSQDGYQTA